MAQALEERAGETAEHFSYSSDPSDLAKAVSYGEMAARRALSVYAYGEVVTLLEQAIPVQEVLAPDNKGKRCDLLLARPGIGSVEDVTGATYDTLLLEAAVLVKHRQWAELLLGRFAGSAMCRTGILYTTCIPRHLGDAAALLGRPGEA